MLKIKEKSVFHVHKYPVLCCPGDTLHYSAVQCPAHLTKIQYGH